MVSLAECNSAATDATRRGNDLPHLSRPTRLTQHYRRSTPCSARCRSERPTMTTISIRIPEARAVTTSDAAVRTLSLGRRLSSWLNSTWCVINGGHYKVLHTEPDRMALRCVACGHRSPGWEVGSSKLSRAIPSDPERLRGRRPGLA